MERRSGPSPSRRRRRTLRCVTLRGRIVLGLAALAIAGAAGFAFLSSASGIVIPADACASPPPLTTWNGVNGWCEPLLTSDPGHLSYGGCH